MYTPAIVVNAKSTANVKILQLKPLRSDLFDKVRHDNSGFSEDVHLHASEMSVPHKNVATHSRRELTNMTPW